MRDNAKTSPASRRVVTFALALFIIFTLAPTALAAAPAATTNPADTVHSTDAILHGHLDPGSDSVTACHFEWGTNTSYTGGTIPCDQGQSFSSAADVTATLGFLNPETTYHFQLVVDTVGSGLIAGGDQAFFTPSFPVKRDDLGSFGPDGTAATSFEGGEFGALAVRQSNRGLFVMDANYNAPGGIYGFDASNPPSFPQFSGFDPLTVPAGQNLEPLAVDSSGTSSDGNLYYVTSANEQGNERQQVTVSATGGTYKLCYDPDEGGPQPNECTSDLPYNADSSQTVSSALQALPALGADSVRAFFSNPYTVAFAGRLSDVDLPQLTCDGANLTGGSGCSVATTAQGVPDLIHGFDASGNPLGGNFPIEVPAAFPGKGGLVGAGGLAVGPDGNIWVINYAIDRVLEYSSAGAFLSSVDISAQIPFEAKFNSGGSRTIAIDSNGDLYLGSYNSSGSYASPGLHEGVWRYSAASGYTQATKFYDHSVDAIAIDPVDHHVFVVPRSSASDSNGNYAHEIRELDPVGDSLAELGREIPAVRGLGGASFGGIAVDPTNHDLYASVRSPDRQIHVFGPPLPQQVPTVTTKAASAITGHGATLNALVDPETHQVNECHFEWVSDAGYAPSTANPYAAGQSASCATDPGSGSGDIAVSADVSLDPGTVYHYRIVAANTNGTSRGADVTFIALGPRPSSAFVGEVGDTTATVHATVDPNGADTTCSFEYGPDASYGQSAPCVPASQPATDEVQKVTVKASAGQFRLSFAGAQTGDLEFDASAADIEDDLNALPTIGGVGGSVAVTGGPGDAGGFFPYAITFGGTLGGRDVPQLSGDEGFTRLSGGAEGTGVTVVVTSTPKIEVTAQLTGLDPAAVYHYRLAATNSGAITHGADATFTTYAATPNFPPCPNDALRADPGADPGPAGGLPDCRAYEQVSPAEKGGANIGLGLFHTEASSSGDAFAFQDEVGGISEGTVGSENQQLYIARRGASGWSFHGALAPPSYGENQTTVAWTADLGLTFDDLQRYGNPTPTGTTLAVEPFASSYQNLYPYRVGTDFHYAGSSSDDSKIFFESTIPVGDGGGLSVSSGPAPAAGEQNLYFFDRSTNKLTLVGVLPASEGGAAPSGGSFAGPFDWWSGTNAASLSGGGASGTGESGTKPYFTQGMHAISDSGAAAFFTAGNTGEVYRRAGLGTVSPSSIRISASQRSSADPHGSKPKIFMRASSSGDLAFFTSCQKLTDDSTAISTSANACDTKSQGSDLYVWQAKGSGSCNKAAGCLTDLTVDPTDPQGADVKGVLGASDSGDYLYFAANGILASNIGGNGSTATLGNCTQSGKDWSGKCNLYLYHAGTISFIARLNADDSSNHPDVDDWQPNARGVGLTNVGSSEGLPTGMVSADGKTLVFRSQDSLTPYDAHGTLEYYRYSVGGTSLLCITCNPTGAPPNGEGSPHLNTVPGFFGTQPLLQRNLSDDGDRFFFETTEKLVAADTNGDAGCPQLRTTFTNFSCQDVYEWEAKGSGSCQSDTQDGGCFYLLSTGSGPDPAFFGDASASGDDVFIFTTARLVPTDADQVQDAYDVRTLGGLSAQHAVSPPLCDVNSGACEGAGTSPSNPPGSGSGSFQGPGNPKPNHRHKVQKRKHKARKHRKKHKHHRKAQRAHYRVDANWRADK